MKNVVKVIVLVAIGVTGVGRAVQAAPITYIGTDSGADSFAAMVNSQTAAAEFDAAAALLGSMNLIDFESVALGVVNDTDLGGGVTLDGVSGSIENSAFPCTFVLCGDNTTVGGDNYARVGGNPGSLVFSFATPIQAFGAYFTGLQGNVEGQETMEIHYTDGSAQTINIPHTLLAGGGAFVGFIDAGASINGIALNFLNDITGTDDVRYGPTAQVPEPTSLLLISAGLVGFAARRRRHTLAS